MLPPQNTYHLPTFHRLPLLRLETFSQFQYLLSSRSRRKFCKRFNRICKHPRQKLFTKFPFDFPYRLIIDAKDKSNQELVLELMQFAIKFDLIYRKVTDQSWNKKVERLDTWQKSDDVCRKNNVTPHRMQSFSCCWHFNSKHFRRMTARHFKHYFFRWNSHFSASVAQERQEADAMFPFSFEVEKGRSQKETFINWVKEFLV